MTLRGGTGRDIDSLDGVRLDGPTFYEHVSGLLGSATRGPLPRGGEPLPDEPPPDPSRLRWGGGSLDGLMAVRGGRSVGNEPLAAAAAVLEYLRSTPTPQGLRSVAETVTQVTDPQAIDRFVGAVASGGIRRGGRARDLARWLCVQGVRREQVKVGLALLGIVGSEEDVDLATHLGMLEELTLYAAVALKNLLKNPDKALLNLADQVMGWGRLHCIHRLRESTDPEVKRWLLYGGYDNGVMVEEIAYIAATAGELRRALEDDPTDDLLDHAGALLAALATGGPAEDMRHYDDGGPAMTTYLDRMRHAPATLTRLGHLRVLDQYLAKQVDDNPNIDKLARPRLHAAIAEVLSRPEWTTVAEAALHSDDLQQVKSAITLVPRFGIDPIPTVRRWLPRAPHDGYLWQTLLYATDDVEEIRRLVTQAQDLLPLSALPTRAADDLGIGPGHEAGHCLELMLQRLRDFPGEGEEAIRVGLKSPVTRCRNMALRAIEAWPPSSRPDDLVSLLRTMAWTDPNPGVKKRARQIAAGLSGTP